MFKTYKDRLVEIEAFYNNQEYEETIVESARLTEKALYSFFNQFHSFLTTREDWNKYLEFEKTAGERYASFLRKPTIGVAIGYYTQLLELFPKQPGLNQEIRRYLNQINLVRNATVHSGGGKATDEDAATVLDSLEKILLSTQLIKMSVDAVGIPVKLYLVYRSVRDKFEASKGEDDFRKIIADAVKILPELLNNFINKLYRDLPLDKKESLTDLYNRTVDKKKESSLAYYIRLCLSLDLQDRLAEGSTLRDSLEFIAADTDETTRNRRQTRHYVTALEIVAEHTDNPETRHFLEFADTIKRRYLINHTLADRDRIFLEDKAQELNISKDLALQMENSVIKIIENELILFQTLNAAEQTSVTQETAVKAVTVTSKKPYLVAAAVAIVALVAFAWLFFGRSTHSMEDYEVAYLGYDLDKTIELTKDDRPIDDIGANFYYIIASYFSESQKIPDGIKLEYRQLFKKNPRSAAANFYLGMLYARERIVLEEKDSAWILLRQAESLGIPEMYLNLEMMDFFGGIELPAHEMIYAKALETEMHPRARTIAGSAYLHINQDTLRAMMLFKSAISIYPYYVGPYLELSNIYLQRQQLDSAREILATAKEINSKEVKVISSLAEVYKREGRFDEAKSLYRNSIKEFATQDLNMHMEFARLLLIGDSISQGLRFIDSALLKFPKETDLLSMRYEMTVRRDALQQPVQEVKPIEWIESEESARKLAKATGKPILLNVFSPWSYWNNNMDRNIFTDSAFSTLVAQAVPLKINGEINNEITKRFGVRHYPLMALLDAEGNVVYRLNNYHNLQAFQGDLQNGLQAYKTLMQSNLPSERFTQVNNFEDARIIARSRKMPIMVVVGDERSRPTQRLIKESLQHRLFKPASKNLVYLYLDRSSHDPILNRLSPEVFPTIFFLNPDGGIVHQQHGYQPGEVLAGLVTEVKDGYRNGAGKLAPRINWFYDLEEAKGFALISKKNIYQYFHSSSCPSCQSMSNTHSSVNVIRLLNESYVPVDLDIDTKYGMDMFDASNGRGLPYHFILGEDGAVLFSKPGSMQADEMTEWLDIRDELQLVSLLGYEKHKKFVENYSLAKQFVNYNRFYSAINELTMLRDVLPDYAEPIMDLAVAYRGIGQSEKAIAAYEDALARGAELSGPIAKQMAVSFIGNKSLQEAPTWFEKRIEESVTPRNKSYLRLGQSYAYEYLADLGAATVAARQATTLYPSNEEALGQLVRIGLRSNNLAEAQLAVSKFESVSDHEALVAHYKSLVAEKAGDRKLAAAYRRLSESKSSALHWQLIDDLLVDTDNYYEYPGAVASMEDEYLNASKATQTAPWLCYILSMHYSAVGKFVEASVQASKAMEAQAHPGFKGAKGYALINMGMNEEAIPLLNEFEQETPDEFMDAFDMIVLALQKSYLNQEEEARKFYAKAANDRNSKGLRGYYKNLGKEWLAAQPKR